MAGVVYVAPGQQPVIVKGIEKQDLKVVVQSDPPLPVDVQFGTPEGKRVMMEIKIVPDDMVSSWRERPSTKNHGASGRLTRQSISLGANEGPSFLFLVGKMQYSNDGRWNIVKFIKGHYQSIGMDYYEMTLRHVSLAMIGVLPIWCPDISIAGETIGKIYYEFQKPFHQQHLIRPNFAGARVFESWQKPNEGDKVIYLAQGLPGIGYGLGKAAWETFGTMRRFFIGRPEHHMLVPRLGKKTAAEIERMLDARYEDYFK